MCWRKFETPLSRRLGRSTRRRGERRTREFYFDIIIIIYVHTGAGNTRLHVDLGTFPPSGEKKINKKLSSNCFDGAYAYTRIISCSNTGVKVFGRAKIFLFENFRIVSPCDICFLYFKDTNNTRRTGCYVTEEPSKVAFIRYITIGIKQFHKSYNFVKNECFMYRELQVRTSTSGIKMAIGH